MSNLHLYNKDGTIKKYDTIYQIIDEHYYVRLNMYQKRKDYQLDNLKKGIQLLESKMRFIEYVIDDKIKVYKQSKQSIIDALRSFEFSFYENNCIVSYFNYFRVLYFIIFDYFNNIIYFKVIDI